MKVGTAFIDSLQVKNRLRSVDPAKVKSLADSIKAIGLQNPIHVYSPDEDTCEIVAGVHRYEAMKSLGELMIDCFLVDMDDIDRQIWEIDENLIRAELSPAQESDHLARRKELWKARANSGKTVSTNKDRGRPKEFAQETADATGATKQSINQKVSRGEKIDPSIMGELTTEEWAEGVTGQDLDAIKSLTAEEQRQAVDRVKSGASESLRAAKSFIADEPDDDEKSRRWRASFLRAITKAPGPEDLEWAYEQLDPAVFDRTRAGRAA